MSDGEREDDVAWLLARERGRPGPSVSEATAAGYAELEALIAGLPATPISPPAGWRERALTAIESATPDEPAGDASAAGTTLEDPRTVLAVVGSATPDKPAGGALAAGTMLEDARTVHRRWAIPAVLAAIAAAMAIVLVSRDRLGGGETSPTSEGPLIAVAVEPAGSNRNLHASVGDTLVVRATILGVGELRVYDDAGVEKASCTAAGASCRIERARDRTTLVLTLRVQAPGVLRPYLFSPPLGTPSSGLDTDVAAAARAGVTIHSHEPIGFR